MTKYTKNGSYPVDASGLPTSDVEEGTGKIWTHLANNPQGRAATGWKIAPEEPPYDEETERLTWDGKAWVVIELADEPAPELFVEVTHKEFRDLLTIQEKIKIKGMRKRVDAMDEESFLAEENMIYQLFDAAMDDFDKSQKIQLTNPQTIAALHGIFVPLSLLTTERANMVLSRIAPPALLTP